MSYNEKLCHSFLTQTQLTTIQDTFQNHFDTFSSGINNYCTVIKEPIKVVNNDSSSNFPGYGEDNNGSITDVTYQEVSKEIPAMIIYPNSMSSTLFSQLHFPIDTNNLLLKVDQAGMEYITIGKTERIVVNGLNYNNQDSYNCQNYFGKKFYYIKLVVTK